MQRHFVAGDSAVAVVLVVALIMFNWWWIFFAVVILIQINWDFKQSVYCDKFSYPVKQKTGKLVRYAVLSNKTLFEVYKMIDKKHPSEFVVTDYGNRMFYESDLEQWLLRYPIKTLLKQCF